MSIRNQILLPVILVALVLAGSSLGVSIWQFSGYVNKSVMEEANGSLKGLASEIESQKQDALSKSMMAANYPGLAAAVAANDTNAVLALMTPVAKDAKVDFLTVVSANGSVIARIHDPGKRGDSLANQANIASALKGTAVAYVEPGTEIKLSARAGAPVKNAAGVAVGAVSLGYKLDQMETVDYAKKLFSSEFTVFLGDERISSTIMQDGKRVVGTKLDPAIAKTVLADSKEYHGRANILGQPYITAYQPLIGPAGKPIGVLFAGKSVKEA